jgi:hypothetical protein
MSWQENAESAAASPKDQKPVSASAGSLGELDRKAGIALGLFAVLAVLAWITLDGTVLIYGRPVELRMVPLVVLGGMALKTILAWKAEKIRRAAIPDREEV